MDEKVINEFLGWITNKFNLDGDKAVKQFMDSRSESEIEQLFAAFNQEISKMKDGGKLNYIKCLKALREGKPCNCK